MYFAKLETVLKYYELINDNPLQLGVWQMEITKI